VCFFLRAGGNVPKALIFNAFGFMLEMEISIYEM
jgi:hypothetical protein